MRNTTKATLGMVEERLHKELQTLGRNDNPVRPSPHNCLHKKRRGGELGTLARKDGTVIKMHVRMHIDDSA